MVDRRSNEKLANLFPLSRFHSLSLTSDPMLFDPIDVLGDFAVIDRSHEFAIPFDSSDSKCPVETSHISKSLVFTSSPGSPASETVPSDSVNGT
jgi:hypothetical protein